MGRDRAPFKIAQLHTLVGYMELEGKASREVRSVYFLSKVFLVAGQ